MINQQQINGVFAAAVTPMNPDFTISSKEFPQLLKFLADRGCHGALLFGTTGEGPSILPSRRLEVLKIVMANKRNYPRFLVLAGTGTPSMEETVELTKSAFDLGVDGVVVLPPYYYRSATDDGLFFWYSEVINKAVPSGSPLLGYQIPSVSGIFLNLDLISRLKDAFPYRFAGLKDSTGDSEFASSLGKRFGNDLLVFSGNDRLFSHALSNHASGCITALANILSPHLRTVWDAHMDGEVHQNAQSILAKGRELIERYQPTPPFLKMVLEMKFSFPHWNVHPPLVSISEDVKKQALLEFDSVLEKNKAFK